MKSQKEATAQVTKNEKDKHPFHKKQQQAISGANGKKKEER